MRLLTAIIFTVFCIIGQPNTSNALDIWHSDTAWANQGMCAYTFTLDGQDMQMETPPGVSELTLEITLLDEDRDELGSPKMVRLEQPFADIDATRYARFIIEGDCNAETFGIAKATGVIGGKQRNLLEARQLTPTRFEPKNIILPAKYGEE